MKNKWLIILFAAFAFSILAFSALSATKKEVMHFVDAEGNEVTWSEVVFITKGIKTILEHDKTIPIVDKCRTNVSIMVLNKYKYYWLTSIQPDGRICVTDKAFLVAKDEGDNIRIIVIGTAIDAKKNGFPEELLTFRCR